MNSDTIKKKTIEHWSSVPIGTRTDGFRAEHGEFTREYFAEHSRFRYEVYSPWLKTVAHFDDFAGKRILEVGCGMGTDLLEYSSGGATVTGCDLTLRHLELAAKRFAFFNRRGNFVNADAENLGFKDDSFDFVYSNGVLHHTPDTAGAFREILRVLRPGGKALIILYHRNSFVYYLQILLKSGVKRFLGRILRGQNPFTLSVAKILSASTDGESNPLTKVYSRREGVQLMDGFKEVTTEVCHLNKGDFPLSKLFPQRVLDGLSRSFGWYLVLRGIKE